MSKYSNGRGKSLMVLLVTIFLLIGTVSAVQAPDGNGARGKEVFKASPPGFSAGTRIQAGGSDMKVDSYASVPCVVDWNEDGKKDLLVGCFYYGNVYLFLNSGTNSAPVFTTGTKLQADGVDLSVAYG